MQTDQKFERLMDKIVHGAGGAAQQPAQPAQQGQPGKRQKPNRHGGGQVGQQGQPAAEQQPATGGGGGDGNNTNSGGGGGDGNNSNGKMTPASFFNKLIGAAAVLGGIWFYTHDVHPNRAEIQKAYIAKGIAEEERKKQEEITQQKDIELQREQLQRGSPASRVVSAPVQRPQAQGLQHSGPPALFPGVDCVYPILGKTVQTRPVVVAPASCIRFNVDSTTYPGAYFWAQFDGVPRRLENVQRLRVFPNNVQQERYCRREDCLQLIRENLGWPMLVFQEPDQTVIIN